MLKAVLQNIPAISPIETSQLVLMGGSSIPTRETWLLFRSLRSVNIDCARASAHIVISVEAIETNATFVMT